MMKVVPNPNISQVAASGDNSPPAVDFKIGDAVVYKTFYYDHLYVVDKIYDEYPNDVGITGFNKRDKWLESITQKKEIRLATKAEIKARRRLED